MTNDSILNKFTDLFLIDVLHNIYKSRNKILSKMSLVTGRLTFPSLQKIYTARKHLWMSSPSSSTKCYPPKHGKWPLMVYYWWHGKRWGDGMCFFCFIHCFFVTIALFSQLHFVVFANIFWFFSPFPPAAVGISRPRGWYNDPIWFPHATVECSKWREGHRERYRCFFWWF